MRFQTRRRMQPSRRGVFKFMSREETAMNHFFHIFHDLVFAAPPPSVQSHPVHDGTEVRDVCRVLVLTAGSAGNENASRR